MGKSKHYYYSAVKKWIMLIDKLPENKAQTATFKKAFEQAIEDTLKMKNGELRIKAVQDILILKKSTYVGVGLEVYYDWHTVQNWVTEFIHLVAKYAGY